MNEDRRPSVFPFAAIVLAIALFPTPLHAAPEYEKLAPFSAVSFEGEGDDVKVLAQIGGEWLELLAIDDRPMAEIVAFSRREFGRRWQKRIGEDLVEVLSKMGAPPGATVRMRVRDTKGEERTLADVAMTHENRKRVRDANAAAEPPRPRPDARALLARAAAEEDLEALFAAIRKRYAYARRDGIDLDALHESARAEVAEGIEFGAFGRLLARTLAEFSDGHVRVEPDPIAGPCREFLPFLTGFAGERLIAFRADREDLLDPERPYVVAIDGRATAEWLAAAERYVGPRVAPSARSHRLPRLLRALGTLREDLGMKRAERVRVTLSDEGGGDERTIELPCATEPPQFGAWPRRAPDALPAGVHYLRIESMDDEPAFLASLDEELDRACDARTLIVDVRGNGGGTRDVLLALAGRLLAADAAPLVANVAAKRLEPGEDPHAAEGLLQNRFLYPRTASVHDGKTRAWLERFESSFRPAFPPEPGEFSAWHYLVLRPRPDARRIEAPVLVLQDEGCFSATDVFLGALAEIEGVTSIGRPSGGGSGRVQPAPLRHSGYVVLLSSMVSFRPDGAPYDTAGVAPDALVPARPEDFTTRSDSILAEALRRAR